MTQTKVPVAKVPTAPDLGDRRASEILIAFGRLSRGLRQGAHLPSKIRLLVDSGVLAPRHLGMFAIVALDGPVTVSDLAKREGVALSTASLLVTQLADAGLVDRHEDATDRRRTVVSVAPEHRKESRQVLDAKLAPFRRALDRMGPVKANALLEGLKIVAEELT